MDTITAKLIETILGELIKIGPRVFDDLTGQTPDKRLKYLVLKHYENLKALVHPPCFNILEFAEDGHHFLPKHARQYVYPKMRFRNPTQEDNFDHEFKYRLNYLSAIGLLTLAQDEYFINSFGKAFVQEARGKGDYL